MQRTSDRIFDVELDLMLKQNKNNVQATVNTIKLDPLMLMQTLITA